MLFHWTMSASKLAGLVLPMKTHTKALLLFHLVILFVSIHLIALGQQKNTVQKSNRVENQAVSSSTIRFIAGRDGDLFGKKKSFIENIGQYGDSLSGAMNMGKTLYGYEGLDMPVLFTSKGLIHIHRKIVGPTHEEREEMERKKIPVEEINKKTKVIDRYITMEWVGVNPNVQITTEDTTQAYHTYGMLQSKARGFKKITYHDVYPGIDVVYSFKDTSAAGFEYSIIVRAGADLSKVKMKYGGDVKSIKKDSKGKLIISTGINSIIETQPQSYYEDLGPTGGIDKINAGKIEMKIEGNIISFHSAKPINATKKLIIDPFVSNTKQFIGLYANKAREINYDFCGNVYVTGGGSYYQNNHQVSKYDAKGVLIWTFNGTISNPMWQYGGGYGGWTVDKNLGKCYLGQGAGGLNHQIVRLNSNGVYDNFISNVITTNYENWKMIWGLNNSNPQIIIGLGNGFVNPQHIGILKLPSTAVSTFNVTGLSSSPEDISDLIQDPNSGEIYCDMIGNNINNKIYRVDNPYTSHNTIWSVFPDYLNMQEANNRPYFGVDNSSSSLAVNTNYLFYWDGINLQAFDKATGIKLGSPITFPSTTRFAENGIIADDCNNVFIGFTNGTIKTLKFDGTNFNDNALPDIFIQGFPSNSVYDLKYDNSSKLLYACGDGFVTAVDVSSFCSSSNNNTYKASLKFDCNAATVTLIPNPPNGSTVNYYLYDVNSGNRLVATNTTGIFTGLYPGGNYSINCVIIQNCSTISISTAFMSGPYLNSISWQHALCGNNSGSITFSGTGGTLPYTYSLDGNTFQNSNQFKNLSGGNYNLTIKDINGCKNSFPFTLKQLNPQNTFTKKDATCTQQTGVINVNSSGGTSPYLYSLNGGAFQNAPAFNNLSPGTYTVTVKDNAGCINTSNVIVINSLSGTTSTLTVQNQNCSKQGSVTINTSSGTPPYLYSSDGVNYQTSNIFNLPQGNYTFSIKDKNGCIETLTSTISKSTPPFLTTNVSSKASCLNNDGSISTSASNGTAPYQYSINSGSFQSSSNFSNLSSGTYSVSVKDNNDCIDSKSITIPLINNLNLSMGADQTICEGHSTNLSATTNATKYSWQPASYLNDASSATPVATPYSTTKFYLTASTGACSKLDSMNVIVNPAPLAFAGYDTTICYGSNAQLHGKGGTRFTWSPSTYLSDAHASNPFLIKPPATQSYELLVTDQNNCTSLYSSKVTVNVTSPAALYIGRDTSLAFGQSLNLSATDVNQSGFTFYQWSPPDFLSNAYIKNPISNPEKDITYNVIAKTNEGCEGSASINIKVYKGGEIYVPSAFSPNGDGMNDLLRAIPVGINKFLYFSIYNRWGQRIFFTTDPAKGWNGRIEDKLQSGVFVWIAEGTDYAGKQVFRKGTTMVIR